MMTQQKQKTGVALTRLTLWLAAVITVAHCVPALAQPFLSGSDGSDGGFNASGPPGTIIPFDPTLYTGTTAAAGIFNFTTITVDAGVTVKFTATKLNAPVYLLSQGNVTIAGTLDLNGGNGQLV